MPKADASVSGDWFSLADLDIEAAEILLAEDGPLFVIGFHIQQAIEKYLKGVSTLQRLVPAPYSRFGNIGSRSNCP